VTGFFHQSEHIRVKHIRTPVLTVPLDPRHIPEMITSLKHRQRIMHLTPLDDVIRRITEIVHSVAPFEMRPASAVGATLAQDAAVADLHPAAPLALTDGWAVHAEATADAGAYAPVTLPVLREVAVGEALRGDGDAVAPLDAVMLCGGKGQLHVPMASGEGVLLPGTDARGDEVLQQTGHRLRIIDVAAMQALGITDVRVRKPRVRVAHVGRGRNVIAEATTAWLTSAIVADGGVPMPAEPGADVDTLLGGDGVDAVAVIGGTGTGAHDHTVHALAQAGVVEAHGIAVSPGETAAFGIVNFRPVLLLPGRLDATVAVWLLIGQTMLAKLRGGTESSPSYHSTLTGKVASTVGLTEFVLVRRVGGGVEPLGSKYLPLATLAHADGWIVVPAASEGIAPGAHVIVRPLP